MNKVGGALAVTRAFGDSELSIWVQAEPYIRETILKPTDTHLVLACDGLWDVMEDQEVVNVIKEHATESAQKIAEILLKTSLQKGTRDNVL